MKNWSHRVENQVRTLLRSHGLLFFSAGSASGLIFLIAIFLISPLSGLAAVTGALIASFAARLAGADGKLVEDGLYGYNGVLAGLGSLSFVTADGLASGVETDLGWPLMLTVMAAATAGLLMHLWMLAGLVERPGLPALTFPSIIGVWLWGKVFVFAGLLELSADSLFPSFLDLHWYGIDGLVEAFGKWFDRGLPHLSVAIFMLIGYAMEQPRRIPAVVLAVVASLALSGLLIGPWASEYPSFTFFTVTPLALALGLFFLGPGLRSMVFALLAMFISAPIWEGLGLLCERLSLPLLTLPFAVTAFAGLALVRLSPRALRRLLPEPVPLHRVGRATSGHHGNLRVAGLRYWRQLERVPVVKESKKRPRAMKQAVAQLIAARRVVALTGAGVSVESGVPDYFSGVFGWAIHDQASLGFEDFRLREEVRRDYWRMSQDFYSILRQAQPSRAHEALAELEDLGRLVGIVTQNPDGLHHRAGSSSERVVEIQGSEFWVNCLDCGARYPREEIFQSIVGGSEIPPCRHCRGILKPDTLGLGEALRQDDSARALAMVERCDLLLVVGTSLTVEPVASLVAHAAARGARLVILNYAPTDFDAVADVLLRGSAGELLEELVSEYKKTQAWVTDSK